MSDIILFYSMAFLTAATIEMWWFTTSLPVHVTKLLRRCGWNRNKADFWPDDIDYRHMTRTPWEAWLTSRDPKDIPIGVQDGLTCPGCFSLHASYIATACVSLVAPFTWPLKLVFTVGGAAMLPWAVVTSLELLLALRRSGRPHRRPTITDDAP